MINPRKWFIRRPGFLIPVFFLSCCSLAGQGYRLDAESAALGSCFVTLSGASSAGLNQAGLGRKSKSSCTLHHIRPFIITDLYIASLSVQVALKKGGPGLTLSTMGITGMRQTSAWFSYGMMLHPSLSAGVGILLGGTTISKEAFWGISAGFAMGLQFRVNNELCLGAHITNPASWPGSSLSIRQKSLMITTGLSYLFYKTARYFTEFHVRADRPVQWCNGLEIKIKDTLLLLMGLKNQPWTLSSGFTLIYKKWGLSLSFSYCMDNGSTPYSSLSYEW